MTLFIFIFSKIWYLCPFFHVYSWRIDRRRWKCIGHIFRLVDDIANERDWKNVMERYEDNNDEVLEDLFPWKSANLV